MSEPEPVALSSDSLNASDFSRIAAEIEERVGIMLPASKRIMVETRLRRRVRALGLTSMRAYCEHVFEKGRLHEELPHLIDVITTNKTDFFREPDHFDFLCEKIIPALIKRRNEYRPLIKVWSAASSNGAEAYTTAMVLHDLAERRRDFQFSVLGTDISLSVLEEARKAVYSVAMVEPVPLALRQRYVMPGAGAMTGKVRIAPEIRRLVSFESLNLKDEAYPLSDDIDVILLRNVLIYFDSNMQEIVLNRMIGHLRPGGYLLIGHAERMAGDATAVRQRGPSIFEKLGGSR